MNPNPTSRVATRFLLAIAAVALAAPRAIACDACNVAFGAELSKERAGSLAAADLMAAARNQAGLPLDSLGSGAFKPALGEASSSAVTVARPGMTKSAPAPAPSAVAATVAALAGGASVAPFPTFEPWGPVPEEWKDDPNIEIIERDYGLMVPPTSYVPQDTKPDKTFTIELSEGQVYIGNGVVYDGFVTNGTIPGPQIVVEEGDIVEMIVVNKGTIPHGASIHSAYTQTSKYLGKINPGSQGRVVFRVTVPGVYLYHCAPGGHAIPMHVLFGQYGMMVVKPKSRPYAMDVVMGRKPDVELYLVQHEFYASGKEAIEGNPLYTTFNGKLFRYVEEPVKVRPGDFVRIYFLNVGPNLLSTFHIVGITWDYVYWQGNPTAVLQGGQSVTAGPTDSFVIDFRIPPDEGAYTMLSHAVGSTARGAIGLLVASKDNETPAEVRCEGPAKTPAEMEVIAAGATRTISPFKPTSFDEVFRPAPGTKEVTVSIIGNSYWPKVIEIEPGTTVRWVNEDVFTYLAGEFAGIHNAVSLTGKGEGFSTALLAHGESATVTFAEEDEIEYMCQPHPYMRGRIIVKKPVVDLAAVAAAGGGGGMAGPVVPLASGALVASLLSLYYASRRAAARD